MVIVMTLYFDDICRIMNANSTLNIHCITINLCQIFTNCIIKGNCVPQMNNSQTKPNKKFNQLIHIIFMHCINIV